MAATFFCSWVQLKARGVKYFFSRLDHHGGPCPISHARPFSRGISWETGQGLGQQILPNPDAITICKVTQL